MDAFNSDFFNQLVVIVLLVGGGLVLFNQKNVIAKFFGIILILLGAIQVLSSAAVLIVSAVIALGVAVFFIAKAWLKAKKKAKTPAPLPYCPKCGHYNHDGRSCPYCGCKG